MAGGRGGRGRGVEKETRNRMMQNLFGNQSNDKDQLDSGDEVTGVNGNDRGSGGGAHHQQLRLLDLASANDEYASDNGGHGLRGYQWEEGQGESHGSGGMAEESKGEAHHVELSNLRMQGDKKDMDREEGSQDNFYADQDCKDEEAAQTRKSGPREDEKDHEVVRDVFDDSDEDEFVPYRGQDDTEDAHRLLIEDEGHYGNNLQSEDMVYDEDMHYESDGNFEHEPKEIPLGPPLNLVAPPMLPPGQRDRMNVIKVSNIMGINPKPFDPETYVEEDAFTMDESEGKKRIHLEDNVVRWRISKNANGTESYESNARFVKWKDGSTQLLIGNEVLDISVNESTHDHSHLFIRNGKGVLQSQGRLLQKMRFMPSSLSSRSHRLLTALVDSQNKRTVKMQTWYDTKDPERVKQERERAEGENIRAHSMLKWKKEKVKRKYTQPLRQRQQLTPGFLEDALNEEEAPGFNYNSRQRLARTRFDDDLEAKALAERRILNAKKSNIGKGVPRKPYFPPARLPRHQVHEHSEGEREEFEYETEGGDIENSPTHGREDELHEEDGYDEDPEEAIGVASMPDEETEESEHKREPRKRKGIDSDEESPSRKQQPANRRKAVVFYSDDE